MTDAKKTARPRRSARTSNAGAGAGSPQEAPLASTAPSMAAGDAKPPSKIAGVITLLKRTEGATLEEMTSATGWLPHTTRAALTGLKKKGHIVERSKRGDVTCYRIIEAA